MLSINRTGFYVEDGVTDFSSDQDYLLRQIAQYEERNAVLQSIIDQGAPPKSTATGFEQLDLETCDCGSYGNRRKEHSPECGVKAVRDNTPVIHSIREKRLNDAHLNALRAALTPPAEDTEVFERYKSHIELMTNENRKLRAEVDRLSLELHRVQLDGRREITSGPQDARNGYRGR